MSRLSPRAAAWLYTALVAVVAGYFLFDIPVQLSDSLQNIFAADQRTLAELFENNLWSTGYLRPLLFAPIRLVYLASDGHYSTWFRGTHVVQLALVLGAVVAALRVRTWADAAVVPLALAVVLSIHTSADTVRESFPVNAYLTVVLACLATLAIARGAHRWWSDPAAVLILVAAALSVETGLLVAVIVVAAWVAGWRGVSRWGVAATVLAVGGYFLARYVVFDVGTPGLDERATGFGFTVLQPGEVAARFAANPLPLYAYNVAASVGSVLLAEPRGGVFWVVRALRDGNLEPWMAVNSVACAGLTAVIAVHLMQGRTRWRRWALTEADRLVLVFLAVLLANAGMNLVYTKDVIMSPSGALFGLAAAGVLGTWLGGESTARMRAGVTALVLVVAASWGVKVLGVHYSLRDSAHATRKAWVYADGWLERQEIDVSPARRRAIADALKADAIWRRPAAPRIQIHWPSSGAWFDTTQ